MLISIGTRRIQTINTIGANGRGSPLLQGKSETSFPGSSLLLQGVRERIPGTTLGNLLNVACVDILLCEHSIGADWYSDIRIVPGRRVLL